MNIRIYRCTKTKFLEKVKEKTLSQEYKHLSNEEKNKNEKENFSLAYMLSWLLLVVLLLLLLLLMDISAKN